MKLMVTAHQRLWAELGAMFVGSVLVLRFLCVPLLGHIATQRARLQDVALQIADATALTRDASAHDARLAQAQQQYQALAQRLGTEASLARVLETFKLQAQEHRVELVAMQPKAADAVPRVVTLGDGMALREMPLTLHVTGRYRHIGEFLALLAEEPFTVVVRSLHMAHTEGSHTQLRAELLLAVYLTEASGGSSAEALTVAPMSQEAQAARESQRQRATVLAWGRDPFAAGDASGEASGLELSGILWDPAQPIAIINGHTVHVGEECESYRVVAITQETVTLTDGTETFHLTTVR